jgi:hypothetical protein
VAVTNEPKTTKRATWPEALAIWQIRAKRSATARSCAEREPNRARTSDR